MKTKKKCLTVLSSVVLIIGILSSTSCKEGGEVTKVDNLPDITGFPIVGTNQTDFFDFNYGDTEANGRLIDVQCASTNVSVGNTTEMAFGVNFADGRIKGYGTTMRGEGKAFNYLLVRGNTTYGENSFTDNGDGTITDEAKDTDSTLPTVTFILTDTGQDGFYDEDGNVISTPVEGDSLYGQDAQYTGTASLFKDNGDGTVTDLNTQLAILHLDTHIAETIVLQQNTLIGMVQERNALTPNPENRKITF